MKSIWNMNLASIIPYIILESILWLPFLDVQILSTKLVPACNSFNCAFKKASIAMGNFRHIRQATKGEQWLKRLSRSTKAQLMWRGMNHKPKCYTGSFMRSLPLSSLGTYVLKIGLMFVPKAPGAFLYLCQIKMWPSDSDHVVLHHKTGGKRLWISP